MTSQEFMSNCLACGGNWTAMLLTGMKSQFPEVYDALPNDVEFTFFDVLAVLRNMCDVDM